LGSSPLMVVSDAQFHAHKLLEVAGGEFFLTSLTPGPRPFVFPYGVSFYALLAPLVPAGVSPVALVRAGASFSGIAASGALFALLARTDPRRAALATVLLQLLPVTFDLYSFGNLSNVFGQAMTVLFFVWWGAPFGGAFSGAALLAWACLAHLSSAIVLGVLGVLFVVVWGRGLLADRRRALALGLGLAASAQYYLRFLRLVLDQLPRLHEGGAGGPSLLDGLQRQGVLLLRGWGIPAVILGIVGLSSWRSLGALRREFTALALTGLALAAAAVFTPLEVRYVEALSFALAILAAFGLEALLARGTVGKALCFGLLFWQAVLAALGIVEGVVRRYR